MAATSPSPTDRDQPRLSLRERKKLKNRLAIRTAAYRLIGERGYEATTIEQIAEAADVSPSTVFRYFPSKEDIVLADECGPCVATALRDRPADEPPWESLCAITAQALARSLAGERENMILRSKLQVEVPAVRARMTETLSVTAKLLNDVLAERGGRDAGELELRVFTAAALSALREVSLYWAERDGQDDLAVLVNRALESLTRGMRP